MMITSNKESTLTNNGRSKVGCWILLSIYCEDSCIAGADVEVFAAMQYEEAYQQMEQEYYTKMAEYARYPKTENFRSSLSPYEAEIYDRYCGYDDPDWEVRYKWEIREVPIVA